MQFLREKLYYEDLYDLWTIEKCLRITDSWPNRRNDKYIQNIEDEETKIRLIGCALEIYLYLLKGDRYRQRDSTIKEWMDRDRMRDDKQKNAQVPQNVPCPNCNERMGNISKDLYDLDQPLRVLFFFECPSCKKRKGIFDDGQPFVSKSNYCAKCHKKLKVSYSEKEKIGTWTTSCSSCGFVETEIEDIAKQQAERLAKEQKEQELLKKYRAEFCLSDTEGKEYLLQASQTSSFLKSVEEDRRKQLDPDYQKLKEIRKLNIVELEKLVSETLEKQKYIKLMLDKPNMEKYVIVPFTVQDADSLRKDKDSESKLQRIIKKTLQGTNWRLMSEGVSYRLGYLLGKLKGYEREEDLLKIIKLGKKLDD